MIPRWSAALLVGALLAPLSAAQNETDIDVDVRETEEDGVQESTGGEAGGFGATSLVVLLVVGVVLTAFVVSVARRHL